MNKNLQTVYNYHNETKHSMQRYAKSLGYMDWETQPNPYRTYIDAKQTILPLSFENNTLAYSEIFEQKAKDIAPICIQSISQFFQFSLGLAAVKVYEEQSWDLRCNASSGNLQPTEAYIILDNVDEIDNGIHHYAPKNHSLEQIAKANKKLDLPKDSFLIAISSIVWREAWKYGERAWRYTQLDCGHALRALEISALMLGWKIQRLNTSEEELSSLIGLNQSTRYINEEQENPDMLLLVSFNTNNSDIDIDKVRLCFDEVYQSKANQLSKSWHKWDILNQIEDACKNEKIEISLHNNTNNIKRKNTFDSKDIVLKRRSAQKMNEHDNTITFDNFKTIISSVSSSLNNENVAVNLIFFIHSVEGLESGLYILIRDIKYKHELMREFKNEFLWEEIKQSSLKLFFLRKSDYRVFAKTISCNQDIAKDGAFSLGMLASFSSELNTYGPSRYKQLYWECGQIGQQLYLEATSLGLSATGIGCYLDDMFHNLLGLENMSHQSLYHFTIGRGMFDSRLSNIKPYLNR